MAYKWRSITRAAEQGAYWYVTCKSYLFMCKMSVMNMQCLLDIEGSDLTMSGALQSLKLQDMSGDTEGIEKPNDILFSDASSDLLRLNLLVFGPQSKSPKYKGGK